MKKSELRKVIREMIVEANDSKENIKHLKKIKKELLKRNKFASYTYINYVDIQDDDLIQIGFSCPEQGVGKTTTDWDENGFEWEDFKSNSFNRGISVWECKPKDAYRVFIEELGDKLAEVGKDMI